MRGSRLAAGYDLSSAYDLIVPARGKALVKTDLEMAIPEGCYGRVGMRAPPHTVCCAPPLHAHRDYPSEPFGLMPCAFLGVQRRARAWHGRTSSTRGRA